MQLVQDSGCIVPVFRAILGLFPSEQFEERRMNKMEKNAHIQCTVQQCKHNNTGCNLCSLDVIRIGTHEPNPTMCECTDCNSFELRSGS